MKRVTILQAIDGYEVGDTPQLTGNRIRELVASGHVERLDETEAPAKKPARKRTK